MSGLFEGRGSATDTRPDGAAPAFADQIKDRLEKLKPGCGCLVSVRFPIDPVEALSGEDPAGEAMEMARQLLRQDDLVGGMARTSFCAFLAGADRDAGEKVAVRLRSWLSSFRPIIGVAVFPEDGKTHQALDAAARANAF